MQSALVLVALAALVAPAFGHFLVARSGDWGYGNGWNNDYYNKGYNNVWNNGYHNNGWNNNYNGYYNNDWNRAYYSPSYTTSSYAVAPYGARSFGYGDNSWGHDGVYNTGHSGNWGYDGVYSGNYWNGNNHHGRYYNHPGYSTGVYDRSLVIPSSYGTTGYGYLFKKK